MTGVEWILLLIGSVFMIGSFFITEKLSPSELNHIAELSESELRKIIDRGLNNAGTKIENAIDEQLANSVEKVDRALEKETNEKIMAISEYSDTVLETMNKTHNEIMFLYSMLNDKHTEVTGMTSDLQRLAADIRSLEETMQNMTTQSVPQPVSVTQATQAAQMVQMRQAAQVKRAQQAKELKAQEESAQTAGAQENTVEVEKKEEPVQESEQNHVNQQILAMHKEGLTDIQIARKLGMGIGEVRLVIGLYRGE